MKSLGLDGFETEPVISLDLPAANVAKERYPEEIGRIGDEISESCIFRRTTDNNVCRHFGSWDTIAYVLSGFPVWFRN